MGSACSLCERYANGEEHTTNERTKLLNNNEGQIQRNSHGYEANYVNQLPNISGEQTNSQCKSHQTDKSGATSQHELQDKISDSDIRDIPKILGAADLKRFYYSSVFGLQRVEVERIEYDNKGDGIEVTASRVLETWRKRKASEATQGKVLQALEESGCMEERRKLEHKWKMEGMLRHQKPMDPVAKVCKEELVKFYKHEMSHVQLLPWCDETRDMDDIYVSLKLEEQGNKGSSKLEKNEDLVTLKTRQDMPATRVLVKGVTGSGKSTLLARLAYRWAQQSSDSPFAQFELLFMITLREVEIDSSFIDAVFQQLLAHDTKVANDNLLKYIESHPDRIIILLDGFDEYKAKNLFNAQTGINGIIAFKLLRDCRVILSSRPYEHLGSHQSHYVSVNLTGFSSENAGLYITKFFGGNTVNSIMVEGLDRRLSESKILISLSNIPVMLMLMCLLWEDEQKLADTQSDLYKEFNRYLWKKYCIKQGKKIDDEDNCGGKDFNSVILGLGDVALAGLCPTDNIKSLVFSESDFGKSADLLEVGCSVGLLTRERLRSRLNKRSAVTFLHTSFQEFCAAQFWASLLLTKPEKFYSTLLQINTWDIFKSKIELLKFCFGLVHNIGAFCIIHRVLVIFNKTSSPARRVSVGHAYQDHRYTKNMPFKPILTLANEKPISLNEYSVDLLKTHPGSIELLESNPSYQLLANKDSFRQLFTGFEFVVFGDPPQTISMFHHYVKSKFGSSLTAVKSVTFYEIPAESWVVIGDTLECMPQVKKLDIKLRNKMTCMQPVHLQHLCEKLSTLSTLNEVVLRGADPPLSDRSSTKCFTHVNIAAILDSIQSKIEKMSMRYIPVADAIEHISHIMTPHLQILELTNAKLKEDHIKIVSDLLPQAPNLQVLDLSYNIVGMASVPLAQQLQICTMLSSLKLKNTKLTDQGVIELAERFVFLPGLTQLDISRNDSGNTGAHALFKHLHYLINLNMFDLTARVDNHCSTLVKECVTAIGEMIPDVSGILCVNRGLTMYDEKITRIRKIGLEHQQ